jgi:hypothetical protein
VPCLKVGSNSAMDVVPYRCDPSVGAPVAAFRPNFQPYLTIKIERNARLPAFDTRAHSLPSKVT